MMKKKAIITACVILVFAASLVTFQFTLAEKTEDNEPPPEKQWPFPRPLPAPGERPPDPPGYTPKLDGDKPILPPKPPIPREEWPPIPPPTHPPLPGNLPPPEISGNVVEIALRPEVFPDSTQNCRLLLFVEDPANANLAELKFDLRITFDPEVIRIDQIDSHARSLYDTKLDNAQGIIELSVEPRAHFLSGWMDLGFVYFTVVGNPGQSTDLDLTITTPVENLTPIDGVVHIRSQYEEKD